MTHAWLLWLLTVAAFDFRQRRVPNWLSLAGVLGAIAALTTNAQPFGIEWSSAIGGAALGFGVLLMIYMTGLMGAGDVKFAGALGFWVGVAPLAPIWMGASLLAGVHAVVWLMLQHRPVAPALAAALSGPAPETRGTAAAPRNARFSRRQRPIPSAAYLVLATLAWMVLGRAGLPG